LSKSVRAILDAGGLGRIAIFASGGLDEDQIAEMLAAGAPIDGFGVGTSLTVSSDVPALDCAYKLQEYAGEGRRKYSPGKVTWPGPKQIWRSYGDDGKMKRDVLSLDGDTAQKGEPLLQLAMKNGRRVGPAPTLGEARARAEHDLKRLPDELRRLGEGGSYPVEIAEALVCYAADVDTHLAAKQRMS
jgi:nicotinate phosphoribosyltransferase